LEQRIADLEAENRDDSLEESEDDFEAAENNEDN
jgi:hypothetical protein